MAPTLRGCAIVGYFDENKGDFEEHNRIIDISNGKFEIKDRPPILLSDFDSLFTNYTVPVGAAYPFSEWLNMVKNGQCPRR